MGVKKRIDRILLDRGCFSSLDQTQASIRAGEVFINGQRLDKPGLSFNESEIKDIKIAEPLHYVSRGGYKLEKALNEFGIKVNDRICLDVGASTGGFTDCLLQRGARKIYAVDVGYGQFDYTLRRDKKVVLLERTNIRHLAPAKIKDEIDIIAIDVSFISVKKFLSGLLPLCAKRYDIIILIKPQFEAEKGKTISGIVSSKNVHENTVKSLFSHFKETGLFVHGFTWSPVKGPKGNIEFLVHLKKERSSFKESTIRKVITRSHEEL